MERGTRGAAVQDRRGHLTAVVVALWGVAAVTAVMEECTHQSRPAPLQGVRRYDEVACPRPGGSADLRKRKTTETTPATCLEKAGSDQPQKDRLREEVRRYIQDGKSGDPEEEGGDVVARRQPR
jgi:hypothetical protein